MKILTGTALLLAVLAAGSWVLALGDAPVLGPASDRDLRAREQLLPYPGAERLTVRRVVAEGDGTYWPTADGTGFTESRSTSAGSGDLRILDLATGESSPVPGGDAVRAGRTGTPGFVLMSRMSPDGRRVAFQLNRDGLWALRVVDLEDGSVRDLFEHPDPVGWVDVPSWSPDGRTVAAAVFPDGPAHNPGQILLIGVDDGTVREVASFETRRAEAVTFSPDGRWLAYQRVRTADSDDRDIYLRPFEGGPELRLTRGPGDHRVAGWLPGGGPFFYLSGDRSRHDLLAVELDQGRAISEPRLVRSDLWHVWPRGFSRDAFFFVQMPERIKSHTARIDLAAGRLTTPLTPIVPATSMDWASMMTWSPSGDRMAYMAGNDLVIRSLATGAERRVPIRISALSTGALVWSPVADRIAIQGADHTAGTVGIHLVDLADGFLEHVIPGTPPFWGFQPRWSPDGQALVVGLRESGRSDTRIARFELATGEYHEVFRLERFGGFALHPDGRQLAIGQRGATPGEADRVILVPVDGGEPQELVRIPPPGILSRGTDGLDWSPDGRYLVLGSDVGADHRRTLWIVDRGTNRDGATIWELATFISGGAMQVRPRFHPGGREISVIAGRNRWEIWTLDNLRPERLGGDLPRSGRKGGG